MKNKKTIYILVVIIITFSLLAALIGVFSNWGDGQYEFPSIFGEKIKIYGKGIYQNDSLDIAKQAIAQDIVTIIIGIPLLILSLILIGKDLFKGRLLLTGTLGYFLYAYTSYSFLSMYNELFLIYVALMSLCFFAFTLSIMSFDFNTLKDHFKEQFPIKFISGFLFFIGFAIFMMWIGKIAPFLIDRTAPVGIAHYTTLTIQAMDLGIIVPVSILTGILLIKRNSFGYLLSSVIIIKGITMLASINAMICAGIDAGILEIILFPIFNIICIYCLIIVMKNIKELNISKKVL